MRFAWKHVPLHYANDFISFEKQTIIDEITLLVKDLGFDEAD